MELLERFITAFRHGLDAEIAAMRTGSSALEIPLVRGEALGGLRYVFDAPVTERL